MFRTNGAGGRQQGLHAPGAIEASAEGHVRSSREHSSATWASLMPSNLRTRMPGIGPTLRDARIRARIDMAEVEASTKIRAKYLRAIENEEWDLLPGPVYIKSFLRTYGDYLGVDSRLLVDEYKRRYERPADQDLRPISARSRDRERRERRRRRPRLRPIGA